MKTNMVYPGSPFEEFDTELYPPSRRKSSHNGLVDFLVGTTDQERAIQAVEHDYYHAFLTAKTLQNIAALSVAEQQAANLAPQSAGRLKAVVDAYTQEAIDVIRGW